MKKVIINGKEITTNLGERGADTIVRGDNLPNYTMVLANFREYEEELVERCARMGYTRIRLAKTTTRIRGFYDIIAYCR